MRDGRSILGSFLRSPSPHESHHETPGTLAGTEPLPKAVLDETRRTRRHPRPTQFDYLHLKYLLVHLKSALERVPGPVNDVLDVFCGTRPYDDLLPVGARCVGLDINARYGVPDVISDEVLPFDDASFDLVLCLEAFHYITDPGRGIAEFHRVLRPGGTAIVAVPHVWEYDRRIVERRYTGPELAALFEGWDDVTVMEDGGEAVTWTTVTGHMLDLGEQYLSKRLGAWRLWRMAFTPGYLLLNAVGVQLDRLERRYARRRPVTLPMNITLTARRRNTPE